MWMCTCTKQCVRHGWAVCQRFGGGARELGWQLLARACIPTGGLLRCMHAPQPVRVRGTKPHERPSMTTSTENGRCNSWIVQLHKSEREKPHSGKTKNHSPTKTPCNQPAIAILTHAQPQHRLSTHLQDSSCIVVSLSVSPVVRSALLWTGWKEKHKQQDLRTCMRPLISHFCR